MFPQFLTNLHPLDSINVAICCSTLCNEVLFKKHNTGITRYTQLNMLTVSHRSNGSLGDSVSEKEIRVTSLQTEKKFPNFSGQKCRQHV